MALRNITAEDPCDIEAEEVQRVVVLLDAPLRVFASRHRREEGGQGSWCRELIAPLLADEGAYRDVKRTMAEHPERSNVQIFWREDNPNQLVFAYLVFNRHAGGIEQKIQDSWMESQAGLEPALADALLAHLAQDPNNLEFLSQQYMAQEGAAGALVVARQYLLTRTGEAGSMSPTFPARPRSPSPPKSPRVGQKRPASSSPPSSPAPPPSLPPPPVGAAMVDESPPPLVLAPPVVIPLAAGHAGHSAEEKEEKKDVEIVGEGPMYAGPLPNEDMGGQYNFVHLTLPVMDRIGEIVQKNCGDALKTFDAPPDFKLLTPKELEEQVVAPRSQEVQEFAKTVKVFTILTKTPTKVAPLKNKPGTNCGGTLGHLPNNLDSCFLDSSLVPLMYHNFPLVTGILRLPVSPPLDEISELDEVSKLGELMRWARVKIQAVLRNLTRMANTGMRFQLENLRSVLHAQQLIERRNAHEEGKSAYTFDVDWCKKQEDAIVVPRELNRIFDTAGILQYASLEVPLGEGFNLTPRQAWGRFWTADPAFGTCQIVKKGAILQVPLSEYYGQGARTLDLRPFLETKVDLVQTSLYGARMRVQRLLDGASAIVDLQRFHDGDLIRDFAVRAPPQLQCMTGRILQLVGIVCYAFWANVAPAGGPSASKKAKTVKKGVAGSLSARGHYVAYIRCKDNPNEWVFYDDTEEDHVSIENGAWVLEPNLDAIEPEAVEIAQQILFDATLYLYVVIH